MPFCAGGFAKVKSFLEKISEALATVIADITIVTGKIKAIEGDLTIEGIIAAIPGGSAIEGYLNSALDILLKVATEGQTLDQRLLAYLDGKTPDAQDGDLVKLAQVATAIADGKQHPQSFYDTAVQVHIEGLK